MLIAATGLPEPAVAALCAAGVESSDEVENFLKPRLAELSDPLLMKNMIPAVERIWKAIEKKETITVFGDYDVDGIASTALLVKVLNKLGADNVTPCLPIRQTEGYGLSKEALERGLKNSPHSSLIVTVDCGTCSPEAVKMAREKGIDVVVTDHHEISGTLSPAFTIVNPKLGGSSSEKMLAGVGVAFKVAHALVKIGRTHNRKEAFDIDLRKYLDFVAVGTVADIVPLKLENRILVKAGIEELNRTTNIGWQALLKVAGYGNGKKIDSSHITFIIAPRINAVGRMGDAEIALELLLTENKERAEELAMKLDAANRDRQIVESNIFLDASTEIDAFFKPDHLAGLVVHKKGWHLGVIGIVAARLVQKYRRPAIVIGFDEDGTGRGSCRSIEGVNILEILKKCSQHLLDFGGHEMAAGIDVASEEIPAFVEAFRKETCQALKNIDIIAPQKICAWLAPEDLTGKFIDVIEAMRPFGQRNPRPTFAMRGVKLIGYPKVVWKKHIKFNVSANGNNFSAIWFNMADMQIPDKEFDIAFHIQRNKFLGEEIVELVVEDIRA
jgi:single-stranded-DNA-specific exonuclease